MLNSKQLKYQKVQSDLFKRATLLDKAKHKYDLAIKKLRKVEKKLTTEELIEVQKTVINV